jgi:hypothetical protein
MLIFYDNNPLMPQIAAGLYKEIGRNHLNTLKISRPLRIRQHRHTQKKNSLRKRRLFDWRILAPLSRCGKLTHCFTVKTAN